jgi:long-chain fatty acid transport protein
MRTAVCGRVSKGLLVLGFLGAAAPPSDGAGFAVENQGARAMGFAGAYVAQAADPSAIFYNAAGIGFLKGRQLYLTSGFGTYNTDFTGGGPYPAAGTLESTDRPFAVVPSFYYSQQVSDTVHVGVGVNRPFGYRARWENPDEFTGRYICTDCEVSSWGVNPTVAWQVRDRLSVGFGVDVRFSSFRTERRILADPAAFPVPTDVASLVVDSESDTGIGFNLGLLASPSESLTIGLAYRHKMSGDFGATGTFTQIRTGNAAVDAAVALALPGPQPAVVTFDFPSTFAVGLAVKRNYWTVEGDIVWTFWSDFDAVRYSFPGVTGFDVTLPMNYESTWQGRLGIEYQLTETWALRVGYAYDRGPQPTTTVSPFLHDSNRHGFGGGATWKHGNVSLDLMARYLNYRHRDTRGSSRYGYDGIYESSGFQLGAGLGFRF